MSELPLSRRAVTRAFLAAPVSLAAIPSIAGATVSHDHVWPQMVADYRAKYAAWMATIDLEDAASGDFQDALALLPPKPLKPEFESSGDILDKTVRELRDACDAPERKAAWADYERETKAWETRRDALREEILAPAKAALNRASSARSNAFDALVAYRVTKLGDLREKIEIIGEDFEGFDIPHDHLADIVADLRHLAGEA